MERGCLWSRREAVSRLRFPELSARAGREVQAVSILSVDRINLTYAAATIRLDATRGAVRGEAHLVH